MARSVQTPSDVKIAALHRKQRVFRHLMEPGHGTGWEDRGARGSIPAFLGTCRTSLTAPVKMWWSIRRPETSSDATRFAFACAVPWMLSILLHGGLLRLIDSMGYPLPGAGWSLLTWVILALLPPVGVLLLLHVGVPMYYKLISQEIRSRAPAVLTHNVFAYSLGPAVLALIPFAGPSLAGLWTAVLLVLSGTRRQGISPGGSVIATVLTLVAVALLTLALYAAIAVFVWWQFRS